MCSVKIQFHGIPAAVAKPISEIASFLLPLTAVQLYSKPDFWKDSFFEGRGGITVIISVIWFMVWNKMQPYQASVIFWKVSDLNRVKGLCRKDRRRSVRERNLFRSKASFMSISWHGIVYCYKLGFNQSKYVHDQSCLILIKISVIALLYFVRGSSQQGRLT